MQYIQSLSQFKYKGANAILSILLLVILSVFYSCNSTKYISEDQYLLRRNKIKINSDKTLNDKDELKSVLESVIHQQPNTYLIGAIPFKLWLYNLRYEKYSVDSMNFQIQSKTVEAPVILDTQSIELSKANMSAHLNNAGYFHNRINTSINTKGKKATVNYEVVTGNRYIITDRTYEIPNKRIESFIVREEKKGLLKVGDYYSNTIAGEERNRLVTELKNKGYYHFGAENIKFELDTIWTTSSNSDNLAGTVIDLLIAKTTKSYQIKIKTIVEDNIDRNAFKISKIGNVVVFMNTTDTMGMSRLFQKANQKEIIDDLQVIYDGDAYIAIDVLNRAITIKSNKYYTIDDYDQTIRALTDLNIFQSVRIRYSENVDSNGTSLLNTIILLSPNKKYDFNYNFEVSGGDIYVFGVSSNAAITNKNLFRVANQLTVSGSYGLALESNHKGGLKLFSQTFGGNATYTVPRFLIINPDFLGNHRNSATLINVGANYLNRSGFFQLRNINGSVIFKLNKSKYIQYNFKPAFVNVLNLNNVSPEFQLRMDTIPAIKNAYQQTFIEGQGFEMIRNFDNHLFGRRQYVRIGVEEAGLLLSGINAMVPIKNYAQYVRLDFDLRQYFYNPFHSFILRLHGGVGIPYDKSQTLPYIKQYFVGGAYSIRGWRPRVLGPGSYRDPNVGDGLNNLFIDQAGDIKLELNAEYRFTITKLFANAISMNGAFFTDIGNIWMAKKEMTMPNAEFNINRLYQDLAMSSGLGFRIDFGGFLVLRLDYAIQMKKPYEPNHYGWTIQNMDFSDNAWRRENTNFNVAIGYPF